MQCVSKEGRKFIIALLLCRNDEHAHSYLTGGEATVTLTAVGHTAFVTIYTQFMTLRICYALLEI